MKIVKIYLFSAIGLNQPIMKEENQTQNEPNHKDEVSQETEVADALISINTLNESDRPWINTFFSNSVLKKDNFLITIKTRSETPSPFVPNRIYSSLKYEIMTSVSSEYLKEDLPFLVAKIQCVDENGEEVLKNNTPVLKGNIECVLSHPLSNLDPYYKGKLKTQFTNVSFHREKKEYCFEIQIFTSQDLKNAILKFKSAPFRVYARKPTKKLEIVDYNKLLEIHKRLSPDEKKKIYEIVEKNLNDLFK